MAAISMAVSAMIAFIVREPVRGKFLTKLERAREEQKKREAAEAEA